MEDHCGTSPAWNDTTQALPRKRKRKRRRKRRRRRKRNIHTEYLPRVLQSRKQILSTPTNPHTYDYTPTHALRHIESSPPYPLHLSIVKRHDVPLVFQLL